MEDEIQAREWGAICKQTLVRILTGHSCEPLLGKDRFSLIGSEEAANGTLRGLMRESILPSSMSAISCRIPSRASQNRSISALSSDSVGSIIKVPATGHDMVGAWNPGQRKFHKLLSTAR